MLNLNSNNSEYLYVLWLNLMIELIQQEKYRKYFIISIIIVFSLFALWLRLIPMLNLGNNDVLNIVGSDDPLYNLRQTELLIHNFPNYAWFDVMTHFPTGDFIYWGPVFTYFLAIASMISGAVTRPEIIFASLLVPPLMATILVPIMYFVGKSCGDWKTGVLASGFIAVVSGQYYYRSLFGYVDHHIAEVLFSTLFCLAYILAIRSATETQLNFKQIKTMKKPIFLAMIAGISYLLGYFTMPTIVLFAMIIAIFTLIQSIIDIYRDRNSDYLLMVNGIIFSMVIIGVLLFGIKTLDQVTLAVYSIGHIYAYLGLLGGTIFLYMFKKIIPSGKKYLYPLSIVGFGLLFSIIISIVSPLIFNLLISSFFSFFGQVAESLTIQEARSWDISLALITFNYGLVLMIGGFIVLAYKNFKEEHPNQIFIMVWSFIILISTWQHIRYEYYLAVNIALLAGIVLSFVLDISWSNSLKYLKRLDDQETVAQPVTRREKRRKKERKNIKTKSYKDLSLLILLIVIGSTAFMFAYSSFNYSYSGAMTTPIRMNQDWKESMLWLGSNTPDTGVDYFEIYDQKTFKYPPQAYGIMSWWDYGHMITFIAKRIPNANPFQRGVAGPQGAAAYFMSTSESEANVILDELGTRYIITDIEMDTGKFWAMSTWYNSSVNIQPYQTLFVLTEPSQPNQYKQIILYTQLYYITMISKLHNFDGSMTNTQTVYYVEYIDPSISGVSVPVITNAAIVTAEEARYRISQFELNAPSGYHAGSYSQMIYIPVETVPALNHYRLVHESPSNVFNAKVPDIRYVKIFEYVKGAHIKGNGIIEVPIETDVGRQFIYRQQSINGEFIVPYSTTGNPYGVRATDKYRVSNTSLTFDITEKDIMQGLTVN